MIYLQLIPLAMNGHLLMLPGWLGYFYYNYSTNKVEFKNGDYHLDNKLLEDKGIFNRNDWYYII